MLPLVSVCIKEAKFWQLLKHSIWHLNLYLVGVLIHWIQSQSLRGSPCRWWPEQHSSQRTRWDLSVPAAPLLPWSQKMGICRREGGGFGVHSPRRPLGERGMSEWTFTGKKKPHVLSPVRNFTFILPCWVWGLGSPHARSSSVLKPLIGIAVHHW